MVEGQEVGLGTGLGVVLANGVQGRGKYNGQKDGERVRGGVGVKGTREDWGR